MSAQPRQNPILVRPRFEAPHHGEDLRLQLSSIPERPLRTPILAGPWGFGFGAQLDRDARELVLSCGPIDVEFDDGKAIDVALGELATELGDLYLVVHDRNQVRGTLTAGLISEYEIQDGVLRVTRSTVHAFIPRAKYLDARWGGQQFKLSRELALVLAPKASDPAALFNAAELEDEFANLSRITYEHDWQHVFDTAPLLQRIETQARAGRRDPALRDAVRAFERRAWLAMRPLLGASRPDADANAIGPPEEPLVVVLRERGEGDFPAESPSGRPEKS